MWWIERRRRGREKDEESSLGRQSFFVARLSRPQAQERRGQHSDAAGVVLLGSCSCVQGSPIQVGLYIIFVLRIQANGFSNEWMSKSN